MSSNNKPSVSVIVLTYNQEHTIVRTLDSILAQKVDFAYEIIIGEDASPSDNTRAVCEAYVAKYPDIIRLMPKAPNKGLLRNYIDCLRACKGDYIAACAGDDWWHNPNKLQLQVNALEQNPNCALCYGGVLINNLTTQTTYEQKATPAPHNTKESIFKGNFMYALTVCYRADMLKWIDFEEFIQNGFKMEDYPMWIIMAQYGDFYCINQPLATYTLNFYSLSNHSTIAKTVEFEESTLEIKRFLALKYRYPIEQLILDSHYRSLLYIGLKYNDRQYVLEQFRNLKANKTYRIKDAIKHALFSTTIGFTLYKAKLCR